MIDLSKPEPIANGAEGAIGVLTVANGTPLNSINGDEHARANSIKIITFTGKKYANSLRCLATLTCGSICRRVNLKAADMLQSTILMGVVVGRAEYSVSLTHA